jgi:signal transduction histidine kinase
MTLYNFIWAIVYAVLLQISIGVLIYLIVYAKKSALLYSFLFFHIMTVLWILHSFVSVTVASFITDRELYSKVFEILYSYIGVFIGGFTGLSWLILSLNFIGWKYSKSIRALMLLSAPTVLLYASLLTNNFHHLFFSAGGHFGPLFRAYSAVTYTYSVAGFIALILYALKQEKYEKMRTLILSVAYLIPLAYLIYSNGVIYIFSLSSFLEGYISLAPIAFSFTTVLIIFIIAKYRFLNITPMAVNKIVDNLNRAVLIIDASYKVISVNLYFIETFSSGKPIKHNDNIAFLNDHIARYMENIPDSYAVLAAINSNSIGFFKGELIMNMPERKFYEVIVQPVRENKGILGRIISFDDITMMKNAMQELLEKNITLSDLNGQLLDKNKQLRQYASTAEQLAIMMERQRFLRDAHDILGHTMTVLITQLKVADILCETNIKEARSKIKESISVAKDGLNELRKSIMGLIPGKLSDNNIEVAVTQLINDFKNTGMNIDFIINGTYTALPADHMQALFRLYQEALTNSLRHGKADHVDIVMNLTENKVKILITDNGCGCRKIVKGFGLTGMEERITSLGGTIHYGSDGESGFNIFVELPAGSILKDGKHSS